jgi:hypothetical protein
MNLRKMMKPVMPTRYRAVLTLALFAAASMGSFAATVTGKVTNKTNNKPSSGDDVVLIAFAQGMQEAARTKTDATGHYSIDVPDNGMHLIRVDHQKATYFEPVQPGKTTIDVAVYDAAPKVEGVSTEADVMRIEAGPQGLRVVENFFVKNESNPPRTQFGPDAYPIYLPADSKIEASAAMGPAGMPVSSSPMPTPGQKGRYAFVFPIRPGETRFQISFTLPYSGSYKFTAQLALPTQNLAIILPKTMKFDGGSGFESADVQPGSQTFLEKNVRPGQPITFTVSGEGVMPRDSQQAGGENGAAGAGAGPGAAAGAPTSPEADTRPGIGLGAPIDTPDPLQKYKWWILSGLALVLVIAAAFFLRGKPAAAVDAMATPAPSPLTPTPAMSAAAMPFNSADTHAPLLAALKEELFSLETERLEGKLSETEYHELKSAFEVVLRRALARQATPV